MSVLLQSLNQVVQTRPPHGTVNRMGLGVKLKQGILDALGCFIRDVQ
jgi:hypothetical protein